MKRKRDNIQTLYNKADDIRRRDIYRVEIKYKERLESLDKMVDNLSFDTMNKVLLEWEKTEFTSTIDEIFKGKGKEDEIIDYSIIDDFNIKNQFSQYYYNVSPKYGAHNACVPISLLFCYFYINEDIDSNSISRIMIKESMKQGAIIYNEWKVNNKKNNNIHPLLFEILKLDICKPFYKKVENTFERGGIFKIIDENFEKQELNDTRPTFKELILDVINMFNKVKLYDKKEITKISLILGIKKHYFLSIIITNPLFPSNITKQEKLNFKFDIFLFDSHGTMNDNIDYIKINNISSLINYISKTYDIGYIINIEHQQSEDKKMNEFDFYCKYGYTSFVFY